MIQKMALLQGVEGKGHLCAEVMEQILGLQID